MYFSKDYLNDAAFTVTFGPAGSYSKQTVGFAKVSGLETEQEFEELQVGGMNDRVELLWKPASRNGTLVLERGAGMSLDWLAALRPGIHLGTTIDISVNNGSKNRGRNYHIEDGVISKVSLGPLDAMSGKILIETLEIRYVGLTVTSKSERGVLDWLRDI